MPWLTRCQWPDDLVASCWLLFTAKPEAPAFLVTGAYGWAVND